MFVFSNASLGSVPAIKGCRIRSEFAPTELLPDFIPIIGVKKGLISAKTSKEIISSKKIDLIAGNGWVFFCGCKTKSSSPVSIQVAIEYRSTGGAYRPSFAVATVDALSDLSRLHTTYALAISEDLGSLKSATPAEFWKEKPTKLEIKGNKSKLASAQSRGDAAPANLTEKDGGFYYISLSTTGKDPESAEFAMPLDMQCFPETSGE